MQKTALPFLQKTGPIFPLACLLEDEDLQGGRRLNEVNLLRWAISPTEVNVRHIDAHRCACAWHSLIGIQRVELLPNDKGRGMAETHGVSHNYRCCRLCTELFYS